MKKSLKYLLIFVISILSLIGLTVLLSRSIFKDKLIEYAIKLNQDEQKLIQSYYVSDIADELQSHGIDQYLQRLMLADHDSFSR